MWSRWQRCFRISSADSRMGILSKRWTSGVSSLREVPRIAVISKISVFRIVHGVLNLYPYNCYHLVSFYQMRQLSERILQCELSQKSQVTYSSFLISYGQMKLIFLWQLIPVTAESGHKRTHIPILKSCYIHYLLLFSVPSNYHFRFLLSLKSFMKKQYWSHTPRNILHPSGYDTYNS